MLKFFRAEIGRKRRAVRREPFNTSLLERKRLAAAHAAENIERETEGAKAFCFSLFAF